jgi:hypothetical protein
LTLESDDLALNEREIHETASSVSFLRKFKRWASKLERSFVKSDKRRGALTSRSWWVTKFWSRNCMFCEESSLLLGRTWNGSCCSGGGVGGGGESIVSVKKCVEEYALRVIVTQVFMSVSDQSERHGVTDNYNYQYDSVRVQGLDHGFAEIMWGSMVP